MIPVNKFSQTIQTNLQNEDSAENINQLQNSTSVTNVGIANINDGFESRAQTLLNNPAYSTHPMVDVTPEEMPAEVVDARSIFQPYETNLIEYLEQQFERYKGGPPNGPLKNLVIQT